MKKIIVAIDGYSSCGKSTMAKDLAKEIGYVYVDTGAMYRAVTLFALRNGLFAPDGTIKSDELQGRMGDISITFRLNPETGRPDTYLCGERVEDEIRTMEVSGRISRRRTEGVRHRLGGSARPKTLRRTEGQGHGGRLRQHT